MRHKTWFQSGIANASHALAREKTAKCVDLQPDPRLTANFTSSEAMWTNSIGLCSMSRDNHSSSFLPLRASQVPFSFRNTFKAIHLLVEAYYPVSTAEQPHNRAPNIRVAHLCRSSYAPKLLLSFLGPLAGRQVPMSLRSHRRPAYS